jgi:hypothetical protein
MGTDFALAGATLRFSPLCVICRDVTGLPCQVRSAPDSRHRWTARACRLWANSGSQVHFVWVAPRTPNYETIGSLTRKDAPP